MQIKPSPRGHDHFIRRGLSASISSFEHSENVAKIEWATVRDRRSERKRERERDIGEREREREPEKEPERDPEKERKREGEDDSRLRE